MLNKLSPKSAFWLLWFKEVASNKICWKELRYQDGTNVESLERAIVLSSPTDDNCRRKMKNIVREAIIRVLYHHHKVGPKILQRILWYDVVPIFKPSHFQIIMVSEIIEKIADQMVENENHFNANLLKFNVKKNESLPPKQKQRFPTLKQKLRKPSTNSRKQFNMRLPR